MLPDNAWEYPMKYKVWNEGKKVSDNIILRHTAGIKENYINERRTWEQK